MTDSLTFLDVDDVLSIHHEQIQRFGGAGGVRDAGLLESAVAQAQATFGGQFVHADEYEMAAAYAFHIAQNQPLVDGNKRSGLLAALVFLDLNGVCIDHADERLYQAMIDLATHRLDKAGLAGLLRLLAAERDQR